MRIWLAGGLLLLAATRVSASDPEVLRRFEQTFEEIRRSHFETTGGLTLTEYTRVLFGGYTTLSGLAIDDEFGNTKILRQADGKFWLQAEARGHTVYGRLRLRYQDFNSGDAFTMRGDGLTVPIGDRYWYRYDWRTSERAEEGRDPDGNWWVQFGRQYVHWVSGLVLSETLYSILAGAEVGRFRIEVLGGYTPDHDFVDIDASRPNYTSDTDRIFWGVFVEYSGLAGHRPYVYVLGQQDENDTVLPGGLRFGYDSLYVAVGSTGQIVTGQWLYRIEVIYETGESTSDVFGILPQTDDDIRAWAARIQVSFLPYRNRDKGLRYELEILLASGDDDRFTTQAVGGNLSGTDDESFNAFGYVNTGLAFGVDLANLVAVRLGASARPLKGHELLDRMRVSVDVFFFAKYDDDAPISLLTFPGQGDLGYEIDLGLQWIVTSDLAIEVYYGIFIPGDAPIDGDPKHFGYVAVSYGF